MSMPPRAPPPTMRRSATVSAGSPSPANPITRGATARSAASPRMSSSLKPTARRGSIKGPTHSPAASEGNIDNSELLKQETEQKENLLVQVQDKEQIITSLTTENNNLTSALHSAETRLNDMYAEQSRSEQELAQRIDIAEKLRAQVRELEKEKRDIHRRYNEQTDTFEAERQAFYDNEQHLKSRIQSLTQARRLPEPSMSIASDIGSIAESEAESEITQLSRQASQLDLNDPEQEPAEMTALRLELSTLATSYSSLQSTLVLLQTQLADLKRVNNEVQEENESYMILLRERTLSGRFDVMKQVGGGSDDEDDDATDMGSTRSGKRNVLEPVHEDLENVPGSLEQELNGSAEFQDTDSAGGRRKRRARGNSRSESPARGESLADLPITGPGLDLAAELGRAQNKDILDGNMDAPESKKESGRGLDNGIEFSPQTGDLEALRSEVKALKDANKALSLYASKIIDRIISQEGFEHVLAADYEAPPPKTSRPKPRPLTMMPSLTRPRANTTDFPSGSPVTATTPKTDGALAPPPVRTQRRSMSFDWRGFSLFSSDKDKDKKQDNLRPLNLGSSPNPVGRARKLDTQEDEEDRKERERLNATMKLMGIEPQQTPPMPPQILKAQSAPVPPSPASRRFSFFGRSSAPSTPADGDSLSVNSPSRSPSLNGSAPPHLTRDALEQAEAENTIAALEAHEKHLSADLARGQGSGFTEIVPRAARKSRRSAGGGGSSRGSGSTVWSAGIAEED
ncbi:hypothetical protein CYLTODRAFT_367062 [Cylindrobasidium torrendii FP15055 ss-10]|uniref:M protein, serotype 2.1 n=1 Tax=Cylindrobasidium torrendii FP15055 ss-10 TaxID=1314674 RepID=A0A0D7BTD0_9AGAR|nr:hypothetical protein CYLTODRAFT_367062 [Cylindrobasidium torrendii FP15055 ss-10]